MKERNPASGSVRLKIVSVMLVLAVASSLGAYTYHLYILFRDAQLNIPQPQVERLIRDLRAFHSKTKRFPRNFVEINAEIWHTVPTPSYGSDGRQARTKNYYYFYTMVNDRQFTLWAVPTGPRRDGASTFFLVATADWTRIWQGKALDESAVSSLPSIPSENGLANLHLIESPVRPPISGSSNRSSVGVPSINN
jgi:hypothetical protein